MEKEIIPLTLPQNQPQYGMGYTIDQIAYMHMHSANLLEDMLHGHRCENQRTNRYNESL